MDHYNKTISDARQNITVQTKIIKEATDAIKKATLILNESQALVNKHDKEEKDFINAKQIMDDRKINPTKILLTREYAIDYLRQNPELIGKNICLEKKGICSCHFYELRDCRCSRHHEKKILSGEELFKFLTHADFKCTYKCIESEFVLWDCRFSYSNVCSEIITMSPFDFLVKIKW